MSGSTSTNTVAPSTNTGVPGRFQTANGQVIDPSGAVFMARGINVDASQMGDASQILADFPNLNFIRLTVHDYAPPEAYASFIDTMTSRGIVVEPEDHTSSDGTDTGGGRGVAFTGVQLTNELNWYSSLASAYASNPYVWFGTDNEPPTENLSPWQQQTYDAIRNTGNNNPVIIELPGGGWPDDQTVTSYGMDPAVYASMTNIIGDVHTYGWSSHYIPDQSTVNYALANIIHGVQTIPSANGTVPVILGEYGPSTDGDTTDANAYQVIQAAQQSVQTSGATAFAWNVDGADTLTDGHGNLTSYGQEVAQWMASRVPPSGAAASIPSAATVSQADVSAMATSGVGMSFISGPNDTQASASGTSGNGVIYDLPAAGGGTVAFASDILAAGATLDLTAALAATDWNGVGSTLGDYLAVTDTPAGAVISVATTPGAPAALIATIAGASNLDFDTLLEHAWT